MEQINKEKNKTLLEKVQENTEDGLQVLGTFVHWSSCVVWFYHNTQLC